MRKGFPFVVRKRANRKASESLLNLKGQNITVKCSNTLMSSHANRLIVHNILIVFQLTRSVNGRSLAIQSVMMENSNDRSVLRTNHTTDSTKFKIGHLVIVDTLDVNTAVRKIFRNDPDVTSSDTTISTTIQ